MIAGWVVRTILVALLLGVAALAAERVAGWVGRPRRWIWVGAMTGSVLVPLLALWVPRAVPELGLAARWIEGRIAVAISSGAGSVGALPLQAALAAAMKELEPIGAPIEGSSPALPSAAGQAAALSAVPVDVELAVTGPSADPGSADLRMVTGSGAALPSQVGPGMLVVGWVLLSLVVLAFILAGTARLRLLRDESTPAVIDGVRVRLSRGIGPAVIGLARPEIVLPRWVLGVDAAERRMILAHEREHIVAKDGWLLAVAMIAVAVMPWNLPLWWQHRRLRLAVETDCDSRVVANGVSRRAYGEVLLRAASGAPVLPWLSPAWGETSSQLERRILAITATQPRHARWLSVPLLGLALLVGAVACDVAQRGRTAGAPSPTPNPRLAAEFPRAGVVSSVPGHAVAGGGVAPTEAPIAIRARGADTVPSAHPRPTDHTGLRGRVSGTATGIPIRSNVDVLAAGPQLMRTNRLLLEEQGLQAAVSDLSRYAWIARDPSGRVVASGLGRMPPTGEPWVAPRVERELDGRLPGRIARITMMPGSPLGEDGARANVVQINLAGPGGDGRVTIWQAERGAPAPDTVEQNNRQHIQRESLRVHQSVAQVAGQQSLLRAEEERLRQQEAEWQTLQPAQPREQEQPMRALQQTHEERRRQQEAAERAFLPAGEAAIEVRGSVELAPRDAPATTQPVPPVGYGMISGVITDADGRPLAGASVTLQPLRRGTVTQADGRFVLQGVPAGTFTLVGVRAGTGRMIRREVEVLPGERQTIHIVF